MISLVLFFFVHVLLLLQVFLNLWLGLCLFLYLLYFLYFLYLLLLLLLLLLLCVLLSPSLFF